MVKPPIEPTRIETLRLPDRAARPAGATAFELAGAVVMAAVVAVAVIAAAGPARAELHWLGTHLFARLAGQ